MRALDDRDLSAPSGRVYHVAAPADDGSLVLDVWESEETLGAFADQLISILASVGITPPSPEVRQVHNIVA